MKKPEIGDCIAIGEDRDPVEILEVSSKAVRVDFEGKQWWIPLEELQEVAP